MTRKLPCTLLLCSAILTILPGCQNLAHFFGGSTEDVPIKATDPTPTPKVDVPGTAHSSESTTPKFPTVEEWQAQKDAEDRQKRQSEPPTVSLISPKQQPIDAKMVAFQPPPKEKIIVTKQEYAPLVQALQLIIDGHHEEAVKLLAKYDDATQEFLLRLLPPLANLAKNRLGDMSPQEVAVMIQMFAERARHTGSTQRVDHQQNVLLQIGERVRLLPDAAGRSRVLGRDGKSNRRAGATVCRTEEFREQANQGKRLPDEVGVQAGTQGCRGEARLDPAFFRKRKPPILRQAT